MDVESEARPDARDDGDVVTNDTAMPNGRCEWFVSSYFAVAALAIEVPTHRSSMAAVLSMTRANLTRPRADGAMTPKVALLSSVHRSLSLDGDGGSGRETFSPAMNAANVNRMT